MASLTPSLGGSSIATIPAKHKFVKGKLTLGSFPFSLLCSLSDFSTSNLKPFGNSLSSSFLNAIPITLSPLSAKA